MDIDEIRDIFFDDDTNFEILNRNFFQDLEIFKDYYGNDEGSVFSVLDRTITPFGKVVLEQKLRNPDSDHFILRIKQGILKKVEGRFQELNGLVGSIDCAEVLSFWEDITEDTERLNGLVYFNFGGSKYTKHFEDILNNDESCLLFSSYYSIYISPFFTIFAPILSFLVPLVFLKLKTNISVLPIAKTLLKSFFKIDLIRKLPLKMKMVTIAGMLIWGFFYFYSIATTYRQAKQAFDLIVSFKRKLFKIKEFLDKTERIYEICLELGIPINSYTIEETFKDMSCFKESFSDFLDNKGKILFYNRKFRDIKDRIVPLFMLLGEIDALLSILKVKNAEDYCFVDFKDPKESVCDLKGVWHPNLRKDGSVKNSIELSGTNIITGPNATGKSTFIKSLAIATLMAQTIGIAPAESFVLSPFERFSSYLHIPDCKGRESLFQAEMNRCKEQLDWLETNENKHSLILIDEIFSSTNYEEGLSAAYAICKKFATYGKCKALITTHFAPLGDIDTTNNYHFSAKEKKGIVFDYKLKKGVSKQRLALKLLKRDGFDDDILNDALDYCDKIEIAVKI